MLTSAIASPHEFFLENGLKVVFIPAAAAPVATIMLVYRVGARNEAVGYTGSSHLLEHMLFKGTPANNRSNGRAFADIMNEIGASKNATTWIDRTNYFETVPSGYLELAIELEADRMRNAFIADADRRSEMTVVRNELERNDNSADRVLNAALIAAAFREHPYHHPTIGWRADVEGVSTDRLRELYDTYYHPDNATAFVVGDFDFERTRDAIEKHFGGLPRAALVIPDVYTNEPPQAGERSVVVKRPGDTAIVALAYHTPAALGQSNVLSRGALAERANALPVENDGYALEVLGRILGRGRTSRLARSLVDAGLALEAAAWNWGSRDPGLFQIAVKVRPGAPIDDVRRELDAVLRAIAEHGPDVAEVERAQNQIAVQRAFARDGTFALAQRLAEFEAVGTWRLDEDYVERVRAVTRENVRDVARAYLHEDNRSLGLLLPGTAKTFDVVPFEPVERRDAAPAAVEAATLAAPQMQRPSPFAARIARGTLPNGIAWRYVANRESSTVHVRALLDAGPAFEAGHPMLAQIVAEMLARGTRSHPRHAIEERLERAGIRRSYYVDDDSSSSYNPLAFRIAGACRSDDLPLLLATIAEELREPAFAASEFALVKAELVGCLRLARTATGWRAMQRFLELTYEAGDPYAAADVDTLLADIDSIDLDDVRTFHERTTLGATPPLISGAGALDEAVFGALLGETLGTVPFVSRAGVPPIIVRPRTPRALREDVVLERKANIDIVLGRAASLVRASDDYFAAMIANGILGQSTLSSRLGLRLRDREGLTYGVTSAFAAAGKIPGPWRIGVSVNPANVDRAIASALDVLRDYAGGPRERELEQQRNSMAGQHHVALATNAGIAAQLERLAYYGLDDDEVDTYRERLAAVTRSDVARAIGKYLGDGDLVVVAAGTFAEVPPR